MKQTSLVVLAVLFIASCTPSQPVVEAVPPTITLVLPSITPTITVTPAPTLTPKPTLTPTITQTPLGGGLGKIAFVSERDGNSEIYVMNLDGSGQTRLTNNIGDDTDPIWSPNGKQIVFNSSRNYTGQVYVINADGSDETALTNNPSSFSVDEPKWSPDGNLIAYVGCPFIPGAVICEIFVMKADGSEKFQLTNNEYDNMDFQWSPDSEQIAFWSLRNGQGDIYVINVDGSGELKLTNNPKYPNHISYNLHPFWFPNGKTIFYISQNFNTQYEIYAIHADGTDETRITHLADAESPIIGPQMWSPDGKKMVVTITSLYPSLLKERICVMNSDGSQKTYITDGLSEDRSPQWSPDGKKIAFISYRDVQPEIYIINPDGSNPMRLTFSNPGEPVSQFQWSP